MLQLAEPNESPAPYLGGGSVWEKEEIEAMVRRVEGGDDDLEGKQEGGKWIGPGNSWNRLSVSYSVNVAL